MQGLVLGKFLPPHEGHRYLVEFAQSYCPNLTVVVGSLASEPIPGELRHQWMQSLFPNLRVLHLTDENPQYPHEHPDFWEIWKSSLERLVASPIDYLFASEPYGQKLAEVLGAKFIPTGGLRNSIPISGTAIRQDPVTHWASIPKLVQPFFTRKVLIMGPESSGKTTLAAQLAQEFPGRMVPEYARTWLEPPDRPFDLTDMEIIARGQKASEQAMLALGSPYLFCDTDPATTALWCQELFGETPPAIAQLSKNSSYHLTLLLEPDLPWESGPLRLAPDTRPQFFEKCRGSLEERGQTYEVISGSGEARLRLAKRHVEALSFGL